MFNSNRLLTFFPETAQHFFVVLLASWAGVGLPAHVADYLGKLRNVNPVVVAVQRVTSHESPTC
jgi:hypothetical protein